MSVAHLMRLPWPIPRIIARRSDYIRHLGFEMSQHRFCLPVHRVQAIIQSWQCFGAAVLISLCYLNTASGATPVGLLDAVRLSLANNTDILIQEKQVEFSSGALQQARGQFDSALSLEAGRRTDNSPLNQQSRDDYASHGFPFSQIRTNATSYNLALDRLLRNGVVLRSSAGITRLSGTVNDMSKLSAQNTANIDFSIRVPLLRNSGEIAAAGESAADKELAASAQDLRFSLAQNVLKTVASYWSLLAAQKNLDIAREFETSVRRMVNETRKLIEADELPASDLNMLEANLLDRAASRISAEQARLNARQSLGLAMGLPHQHIATLELADEFPAAVIEPAMLEDHLIGLIALAVQRRPDFKAAQLRRDAARTLSSAAQTDLKPQLDLTVRVGYSGLAEGAGPERALSQNRSSPNIGISLSYQWPLANNVARGRYRQQAAVYDQNILQVASIERSIGLGVEATLSGLVYSAQQLRQSEEAVDLYRIAEENEKTKYKLGSSTMLNVLTISDSLLSAELGKISYRLNYLNALAELNFQTGALIAENKLGSSIGLDQLVGVPKLD